MEWAGEYKGAEMSNPAFSLLVYTMQYLVQPHLHMTKLTVLWICFKRPLYIRTHPLFLFLLFYTVTATTTGRQRSLSFHKMTATLAQLSKTYPSPPYLDASVFPLPHTKPRVTLKLTIYFDPLFYRQAKLFRDWSAISKVLTKKHIQNTLISTFISRIYE